MRMHGGDSAGMPIALWNDRDYAVAQADSQFLLEPVVGPQWSEGQEVSMMWYDRMGRVDDSTCAPTYNQCPLMR